MKITLFSTRIDKDQLPEGTVLALLNTIHLFNQAKHYTYQEQLRRDRQRVEKPDISDFVRVKERYHLPTNYARDVVGEATAMRKSQQELEKLYQQNVEAQIKATKKKIKGTRKALTEARKIKASLIKGKPKFPKRGNATLQGEKVLVKKGKETVIYDNLYLYEHQYLDLQIRRLKARAGQLTFRLHRLEQKKERLKKHLPGVVFGTKTLFKKQYTVKVYRKNHTAWKKEFEPARYHTVTLSGRKDAKDGNFSVRYEVSTKTLYWTTVDGKTQVIPNVTFPYGEEKLVTVILTQQQRCMKERLQNGQSVAWSIEDHGAYFLFKSIFDVHYSTGNYSKAMGVLGVDLNYDHLAVANINAKGQLIKSWVIDFGLEGKTSGQIDKIIEAAAITLVDQAVRLNKPIILEKLDTTTSKVSNPYDSRKRNRKFSMFAYKKLNTAIESRAAKMGVVIFRVNPAYTSQIGKMKYMKTLGISIHQAASYVIARRGMGFKEKLPPMLSSSLPEQIASRHHWAQWGYWTKKTQGIKVNAFYSASVWNDAGIARMGVSSSQPPPVFKVEWGEEEAFC